MRNDQPVRHGLQMFLKARIVFAKTDLFAGENDRVFAHQILDFYLFMRR